MKSIILIEGVNPDELLRHGFEKRYDEKTGKVKEYILTHTRTSSKLTVTFKYEKEKIKGWFKKEKVFPCWIFYEEGIPEEGALDNELMIKLGELFQAGLLKVKEFQTKEKKH